MKSRAQHRPKRRRTMRSKRNGGYGCGCGSQGCPIAPFPMKLGGKCSRTKCRCNKRAKCRCYKRAKCRCYKRSTKRSGGGHFYQQGAPVPPPFVGEPWTATPNTWPGYGASNNHGNHFAQNMYYQDPKMMMKLGGKRKRSKKRRRGGASFLQNAANSYRDLEYNFKSAYNAASGYEPPVNPLPYKDQLQPRQN
jgi:hypothetical protein